MNQVSASPSQQSVPVSQGDDPVRDLQRDVNRLFNDFFSDLGLPALNRLSTGLFAPQPAIDIAQAEDSYTITAELPGLASPDIQVTAGDGYITLKGEKSQDTQSESKGFYRRERSFGSFQRLIDLPKDADFEHINAEMKNGLLTVNIPRRAEGAQARKIDIREVA
jgi:HSP20 family protein